ncbi:type IV pilin N-terminal domain-containing protein [Haloterrigena sp. SYSU A558-1]|uniref:Type IV pilin N-terminal domain-containing protein n=1 Tax=Haloterrigena gelatinilytica TaxID=2741724 RepID=A0ABX2LEN2_9EURY|nr:type IV pilin N-terminal domain-containing protein [Haloterrigena gelatinilytica]NUC71549.1 type IV pilin N-terminal domain-containing protein [Haloterrigena gelatinilytica]
MDLSKYRNKLVGSEEERAVSPVIGVILMVAITVILAAVIAAFVLDMGDSMGSGNVNAVAETDVQDGGNETVVTVTDIGDADGVTVVGSDGTPINDSTDAIITSTGESVTFTNSSGDDYTTGESYTVQAFTGDADSSLDNTSSIDDQTDSSSIIAEFST